jgi:hypothetical protein
LTEKSIESLKPKGDLQAAGQATADSTAALAEKLVASGLSANEGPSALQNMGLSANEAAVAGQSSSSAGNASLAFIKHPVIPS